MKNKTFRIQEVILVFLVGFALAMFFHLYLVPLGISRKSINFEGSGVVGKESPRHLRIPIINIDAPVEPKGLTVDGAMDVPQNPDNVGWLVSGIRPGDIGNAVMAGHFGWKNGIPAVFDNLSLLKKGDLIYVEDGRGVVVIFVVRESHTYESTDDASEVFVSGDGISHLNLITCQGFWNKALKSYSQRFVVFADKKE